MASPQALDSPDNYAGRMGQHNVVIASLPAGVYGTTSAATTASSLIASLPSIRVGLLVGIGGGIARPDEGQDIRLGDIVVSQPDGTTGGVCQYDLFKAKHGNKKERKVFLRPPPTVLLNALASIQARHKREDSKVTDFVQGMLEKYPMMRRRSKRDPGFAYQGIENDRLFKASYNHVHGPACRDCSAAGEVQRDARDSTDSEIHYGIIASGNTLVKDAAARDQIVDNIGEDCLCFEMEAAGLMDEFPCLVIRGICDYADSHKNDQWQQYASATAAAVVSIASERHAEKIKRWLQPPDPSTNANHARKLRHEGTGMWLLEHPVFQSWCTGSRRYSWLHGLAGCGKTILSTTVLDHLTSKKDGRVLSFFFDFSDTRKQSLDGMLRSLAFQLYQSTTTSTTRLDDLFKNHENGGREPATKAISDAVCEMLATSTEVCIVLDALDESTSRRELLKWIEDVAARPDLAHVQLLCTARPEPEFLVRFDRMMGKESCISLDKTAVNTDIQAYVAEQLATRWEFQEKPLSPNLIQEIVAKVGGGADGMNLPKDLEETYKRMLSNIPKRDKDNAIRLLQFLVHTRRPLMLGEAIEILATDTGAQQPGFDEESRVFGENEVLGHCPSLMAIFEVTERIHLFEGGLSEGKLRKELHLAHFSVKEYLRSAEWFDTYTSSVTITKTCLTYLRGISGNHRTIENDYPFAKLAAEIWTSHAASSQSCEEVFQASLAFIEQEVTFRRWCHLHQPDWESYEWRPPPRGSRFYYACLEGLTRVAHELMRGGVEVNAEGGYYNNALQAASVGGHDDVVKLLLDNGADPNKKGGIYGNTRYRNALQAASYEGHVTIVNLLLEKGADVNTLGGWYGTALSAASKQGHIDICKLLVAKGADIYMRGGDYDNALEAASRSGHIDIVKLLLANGADVNTPGDGDHCTVLSVASERGYTDIVELLLANGADVNAGNALTDGNRHRSSTPLYIASKHGHADTVRLLLKWRADANIRSGDYGGALSIVSYNGHVNIVKVLLDAGADPNAQDYYGRSPLQAALFKRNIGTVRLLLEKVANPNAPSSNFAKLGDGYDIALEAASLHGWGDLVKLLGADVNAQDDYYGNALWAAIENGRFEVVNILLDSGAIIGDSLCAAVSGSHDDIVKLLLERGADVNTRFHPLEGGESFAESGSLGETHQYECDCSGDGLVQRLLWYCGATLERRGGRRSKSCAGRRLPRPHRYYEIALREEGGRRRSRRCSGSRCV
ncbi:hypothetical protein CSUB01_00027 [Colletotrichum sublineola]|uniref:Nephrocystin 3-like N-terminal domain-containing protein n=1 Tax=Colletotrichum sublineola TaxID=1173701 RepID=A0A066XXD0_COLSU|nr:hypothetical protein CSUB01_00027 [Colletotrichum sublineola]